MVATMDDVDVSDYDTGFGLDETETEDDLGIDAVLGTDA
jgi:hypothetical protein